jgi:hypothetical protein
MARIGEACSVRCPERIFWFFRRGPDAEDSARYNANGQVERSEISLIFSVPTAVNSETLRFAQNDRLAKLLESPTQLVSSTPSQRLFGSVCNQLRA